MWHDPDDRLQKAIDRYEEGDVEAARAMLRALDRQGVISPRIDLYLGHCHMDDDHPRAALRRYRRAVALASPHLQEGRAGTGVQAWIGIALCHGRLGNLPRAVVALERARRIDPEREEIHCHLVHCHALLGHIERAERHARAAVRSDPGCPHIYRHLALAYALAGRPGPALGAWHEVRRLDPEHPELDVGMGRALAGLGRRAEARRHLLRGVDGPQGADAHTGLGDLALGERSLDDAVAHYQNALACDPDHVEARLKLAEALGEAGRLVEARSLVEPLVEAVLATPGVAPDAETDGEVLAVAGRILVLEGRPARALALYRRAWRTRPRSAAPPCLIGELLLELRRPRAALPVLRRGLALARRPSASAGDVLLAARLYARALGRAGQRKAAVRVLAQTAWRQPDAAELYVDGAAALLACMRPGRAERVLSRGLARRPDHAGLWTAAAELALEAGRSSAARDRLRQALRRDRRHPEALALLTRWLAERGAWKKARHAARAACRVLPPDHPVVRHHGEATLACGRAAEAVLVLRRYVLAAPADPQGYRLLARALDRAGNPPAARLQERLAALVG